MRIFVTGGTGVLGSRVVPLLVDAGHGITAVARSPEKAAQLRAQRAEPIEVDLFDPDAVRAAVAGHDAVAHLATNIPPLSKAALASAWEMTNRLRREASAHLVDAALATGVGSYVQESIAFTYADGGDRWLDEDSPLDLPDLTRAVIDAEQQAQRFTDAGGTGVALRFGQFLAADSIHVQDLAAMVRKGVLPLVGEHDGYESFIHADDAASAVVAALDAPPGIYNVVEDEPLTRRQHAEVIGELLGRRVHLPPQVVGKLPRVNLRARSLRVSNARFREATGWAPRHASTRSAWGDVLGLLVDDVPPQV